MKTKTLHRQLHPIHWHASMFVAIAALLLTTMKSSGEMLRALRALPVHTADTSSFYLRDAENVHLPVILTSGIKHAVASGK